MKFLRLFLLLTLFAYCMSACSGDTNNSTSAAQTEQHSHDDHDHSHDGHDHDHSHDGHDHDHDHTPQKMTAEEMEALKAKQAKKEKARQAPATAAEKATAKKLCDCLTNIPTLAKVLDAKDQDAFNKAAGSNLDDVRAMQQCHNTIVTEAIKKVPEDDRGVYAFRARREANKNCLNRENDDLWFMMGKFVAEKTNK